jgi:hypothetical protein
MVAKVRQTTDGADRRRPIGITALSLFFVVGAGLAAVSAASLTWPGGVLEPMWRLNTRARQGFASMHGWGVPLMIAVSLACAVAGLGLWRGRPWGRIVAVGILVIQLAGDVLNVALGLEPRAMVGIPIVAALLAYLTRTRVGAFFGRRSP